MSYGIDYHSDPDAVSADEPMELGPVSLEWDTVDANAEHLKFSFPAGSGTQVPVVTVGVGVKDVDLTYFNGSTEPAVAVIDADRDSYLRMTFSADDTPAIQIGGSATALTVPTLASPTLTTPTIAATGWTNATHVHAAGNSGGVVPIANTSGTLAVNRGGTGATSFTTNAILTGNVANAIQAESNLTFDGSTLTLDGDLAFTGAQAITTSTDNLTIGAATGADVLIGDNATILYVDGGAGVVSIGDNAALASRALQVVKDFGEPDASVDGIASRPIARETTGTTGNGVSGLFSDPRLHGGNTQNWTQAVSFKGVQSRISTLSGAGGTITGIADFYASSMSKSGSETITTQYGMYIEALTGASNNVGINLETISGSNPIGIDMGNNSIENVGASGNDWTSSGISVTGATTLTNTGGSTPIALNIRNLQTKAENVGTGVYFTGHTGANSMGYLFLQWEADSTFDPSVEYSPGNFEQRPTKMTFWTRDNRGSIDPVMQLLGTGELDLMNNGLLNVGSSGNNWTQYGMIIEEGRDAAIDLVVSNTTVGTAAVAVMKVATQYHATGGADPLVHWRINGGTTQNWYAGIDNTDAAGRRFTIGTSIPGGADSMRITTAGATTFDDSSGADFTPDYVCDSCGRAKIKSFECCGTVAWHDDVLALREMNLSQSGIEQMAKLGVLEIDGSDTDSPGWMGINFQKGMHMTWAGMWQNRERMDVQYQTLDERLSRIERAIGV